MAILVSFLAIALVTVLLGTGSKRFKKKNLVLAGHVEVGMPGTVSVPY